MKEHTSESGLTTDFFILVIDKAVQPNIADETAMTWQTGAFPKLNWGKKISSWPTLWSVSFHVLEAFLHQKSYHVDMLGLVCFSH